MTTTRTPIPFLPFTNDCHARISGTSLQGCITASYDSLVDALGEPTTSGVDNKTQVEWWLTFADGTVATVYDWKAAGSFGAVTNWHVGGRSARALALVESVLQ